MPSHLFNLPLEIHLEIFKILLPEPSNCKPDPMLLLVSKTFTHIVLRYVEFWWDTIRPLAPPRPLGKATLDLEYLHNLVIAVKMNSSWRERILIIDISDFQSLDDLNPTSVDLLHSLITLIGSKPIIKLSYIALTDSTLQEALLQTFRPHCSLQLQVHYASPNASPLFHPLLKLSPSIKTLKIIFQSFYNGESVEEGLQDAFAHLEEFNLIQFDMIKYDGLVTLDRILNFIPNGCHVAINSLQLQPQQVLASSRKLYLLAVAAVISHLRLNLSNLAAMFPGPIFLQSNNLSTLELASNGNQLPENSAYTLDSIAAVWLESIAQHCQMLTTLYLFIDIINPAEMYEFLADVTNLPKLAVFGYQCAYRFYGVAMPWLHYQKVIGADGVIAQEPYLIMCEETYSAKRFEEHLVKMLEDRGVTASWSTEAENWWWARNKR